MNESFNKLIDSLIERRIADFDGTAAQGAADLMAAGQKKGSSGELRDTMIAGMAMARHAILATRNTHHFEGASFAVVNPFRAGRREHDCPAEAQACCAGSHEFSFCKKMAKEGDER